MPDIDDLMGGEPSAHPLLSDAEIDAAKKKARDQIMKAKKDAAILSLIEDEKGRLLREEGLTTGDGVKDEQVKITVDLPEFCDKITFNGQPYWHGHTYQLPRHVADSMREVIQNTWRHQDREIDGKDLNAIYRRKGQTVLSPLRAA
jgi:hypothetical protein